MIKTNKLLRLKTKNGRLLDVVREHYLRRDVPCHSEICADCEKGLDKKRLQTATCSVLSISMIINYFSK